VIGSIVEYLFAPDDPEAVIEKMAAPATRIVSLTVTEGGYNLDAVTGEFNASDPAVLADLRPGAVPRTVFGLVTEALARRRDRGIPAFSIPVLRQHRWQRPREPADVHRVRPVARSRAGRLDHPARSVP
jgi:mannitol-1-phosphate/altronate dehydrogenase